MRAKFINESKNENIVGYHATYEPMSDLKDHPIWLAPTKELGLAYWNMFMEQQSYTPGGNRPHLYEITIQGHILPEHEIEQLCEDIGLDYFDFNGDLASNPTPEESSAAVSPFLDKCDGFLMSDYDPRDSQSDVESLCLIKPLKTIKNIKKIK